LNPTTHHITALAAVIAIVLVPIAIALAWRFVVRWRQRRAREAMRRGNALYREWLARSQQPADRSDQQR
jgi:uncharacterized membrane-anchored protein